MGPCKGKAGGISLLTVLPAIVSNERQAREGKNGRNDGQRPVAMGAIDLLKKTMLDRSIAEIVWGFPMIIGTILYIMADVGRAKMLSRGRLRSCRCRRHAASYCAVVAERN
jgi:Tetracyclin repressor-like, C-terminal domain